MPIPRLQPSRIKRLKPSVFDGPSLDNLDDFCLSKIIVHTLSNAVEDLRIVERNLSLVSKRWYWLTQSLVGEHGNHKINLNKLAKAKRQPKSNGPRILSHNNDLFRLLQPRLLKYKNIQLEGSLTCEEFRVLVVALNAARTERLSLKIDIEKDGTLAKNFAILPKQLMYLKELTLLWYNDSKNDYSNGLTWTIFTRSTNLKNLEIHLTEPLNDSLDEQTTQRSSLNDSLLKVSNLFSGNPRTHTSSRSLERLVFKRSLDEPPVDCSFTLLVKHTLANESHLNRVDTNDTSVIEYLIKSSERVCTMLKLKSLKLLSPIRNVDLLSELLSSKTLGTNHLSFVVDNFDHIEEVRKLMEIFKPMRHDGAICHLSVRLKDQKFSDCEDKIQHLVHLCRIAKLTIYFSAIQRISIDCCHLMWSIGRNLQSSALPGSCFFKINVHQNGSQVVNKQGQNLSEITIPFGEFQHYKINPNVEDEVRHREIIKSIKKNCYNSFVKSVRDNVVTR